MTKPVATADFFALEAGECLDRLEALAGRPEGPPPDEFLRAARVLRGSALMASQQPIARAAGGLEGLARAYRDGRRVWDPGTREQVTQALEEFRLLVRRVRDWTEADTARTVRLGLSLESLAGRSGTVPAEEPRVAREPPREPDAAPEGELNAGVRAFVAREGALIASALDRAARALHAAPADREPLYTVIRRMQSLRGLAELSELTPLPEILDGIEMAVGDLTRLFAPPPGVGEVIAAASVALTRISRDIADRGRPVPGAPEATHFTELLLRAFAVERDVVPIESLFHLDDPAPITPPLAQPQFAAPSPLGPLELVSHGEHLCQSADLIAGARSPVERDLRLYHLLGSLRGAGTPGPDPVAGALVVFARSAREALAAGVAARSTPALVDCLRETGELLRAVADADDRMLISRRILDSAYRLDGLRLAEAPRAAVPGPADSPPRPSPAASPAARPALPPIVSIESLLLEQPVVSIESLLLEQPVVSIESLLFDQRPGATAPASESSRIGAGRVGGPPAEPSADALQLTGRSTLDDVVPIESLGYDAAHSTVAASGIPASEQPAWGLEASFRTFDRLRRQQPPQSPSLEGLVGRALAAVVPAPTPGTVEVEIGALVYRGRAALERAAAVRQQLADELARQGGLAAIQPLLQELLDLVPLALAGD
ncbi:MAG TPA: hypothetical protein VHR43_03250 [Gemmatimonadales bacterium]|nr:hypothetical protein [Gemmatimonadales bacterium]